MRKLALALVALGLVAALAGCGGGGQGGEKEPVRSLSAVAAAAEKTTDAGSAKFSLAMRMEGLAVPGNSAQAFTLGGEGAFDYESRRGRMVFDLGGLGSLLGQEGGGSIEMILDGNVFYMKFPLLSGLAGGDKPWVKLDLEELSDQQGVDLGQLQQLQQGDPTQMLAYLRAAGDFEEVGKETVRDVETTHYRGTIDLKKALETVPEGQREQIVKLIDEGGLTELPAEAWIDGDGLLRKMALELAKIPDQEQGSMTMEMELYDYGAEVDVQPPPADQVADLGELFKGLVPTTTTVEAEEK